jgi:hypothetical protein
MQKNVVAVEPRTCLFSRRIVAKDATKRRFYGKISHVTGCSGSFIEDAPPALDRNTS